MTDPSDLPVWGALLIGLLALAGAGLALIGSIGLLRFPSFFQRIHAPTLGTTLGGGAILIASMLFFSLIRPGLVLGELLIASFLIVTTPISFIALAMAAGERSRNDAAKRAAEAVGPRVGPYPLSMSERSPAKPN